MKKTDYTMTVTLLRRHLTNDVEAFSKAAAEYANDPEKVTHYIANYQLAQYAKQMLSTLNDYADYDQADKTDKE